MTSRFVAALFVGTLMFSSAPADALQCVPFAREISGISIRGDAWTWWSTAAGVYDRGQAPRVGAVVVFKKHGKMRYGHVAVVARVVNSRQVMVDHANWAPRRGGGRGQITKMVAVTDVSARNDWTKVRVWNEDIAEFGTRVYPTYGFIYAKPNHGFVLEANYTVPSADDVVASIPVARMQRLSQSGDPLLATADRQIASALDDRDLTPVAVEVKPLPVPAPTQSVVVAPPVPASKPEVVAVDTKPVPPAPAMPEAKSAPAPAPEVKSTPVTADVWEGDLAAAKKFGAGHY